MESEHNKSWTNKLKQLGWLGFLFFFVKGLIWIAVFLGLGEFFGC